MKDLKGKRLLLLGGSLWKDIIKKFADEQGIILVATGTNKNTGIFEIADECYDIDSTNEKLMKKLLIDKKIDGVYLGGNDKVISSASKYLNDMKFPCYCTKEQWDLLDNKENFKKILIDFGLPVVESFDLSIDEIKNQTGKIKFPVITKPSDSSGSEGFSISHNYEELLQNYKIAQASSPTKSVIIEKFVKNDGMVAFYTFSDGKMYFSGLEDKYPVQYEKNGSYIAGFLKFQSSKLKEFEEKFNNKLKYMFNDLGIKEGSIWIEVFFDGKEYFFNEAGFRYGGSVSVYPVEYYYNYNQVASDIYYALTGESNLTGLGSIFEKKIPSKYNYGIYTIVLKPGQINDFKGIDEITRFENVVSAPVTKNKNSIINSLGTIENVFSFIHFVYDSIEECKNTIDRIHKKLKVVDKDGNNMVVRLFDVSILENKEKVK